jgi:hypothetical protein
MSAQDYYGPYPPRQESSGKALASLILGVCGLFTIPVLCSALAIVFATQARAEIAESQGRLGGASNAQVGLVLGWIGLAIGVIEVVLALILVALIANGSDLSLAFG